MIVSVHKAKGLGAVGYSVPNSPIPMADGRFAVNFVNPNGTSSTWFSNYGVGIIPGDNNFVNPPDSVWQGIGLQGTQVQANLTAQQVDVAKIAATAGPVISYTQAMANQAVQVAAATANTTSSSGGSKVASFSFTSSGGNSSQLQVGDSWTITITGAMPNSAVTVNGTKNGGSFGVVAEGATDSSGNFSKSATVGSGDIGTWQEVWSVGSTNVGAIMFSVVQSSGTTPPSQASSGAIVTTGSGGTTNVNTPTSASVFDLFGDTSAPISIGSFQIGEYTALGLVAVVVVGLMMFSGGRR